MENTTPINILLVDDLEKNLLLLEAMLEDLPYNLVKTTSGKEALEQLYLWEFALMITDVQMPEMSGLELAETILKDKNIPNLPIIFVTANTNLDPLEAYQVGAADYITKPVNQKLLLAKVAIFVNLYKKNKELLAAKEVAEKASQTKSNFLAIIGHEIRNPISSVLGLSELLLETSLNFEQQSYIQAINQSGNVLIKLINDLLDFSKMEAGKLELEELMFNPRELLEQTLSLFSPIAKNKNLEFLVFIDPTVPWLVKGDPNRLRQILTNLVSNATKFTQAGAIRISISLVEACLSSSELVLKFTVSDTGKGISENDQKNLFQPYKQENSSISSKFGGTGLGLSISKKLVELMNGQIGLESQPGIGTTFWFTVYLSKTQDLQTDNPNNEENNYLNQLNHLHNKLILIASSYSLSCNAIQKQLLAWRLNAKGLSDEKVKDLRLSVNKPYDLLIIDLPMVETEMVNFLENIQTSPNIRLSQCVFLVPFWQKEYFLTLPIASKVSYLTKPVYPSKFFEYLKAVNANEVKQNNKLIQKTEANLLLDKLILVVEDNSINQIIIQRILNQIGYKFDMATSGKETLHALSTKSYDLLLTDCHLEDMTGFEITTYIRKCEKETNSKPLPIIALTATALDEIQVRAKEVGMDEFLIKPVSKEILKQVLDKWLLN